LSVESEGAVFSGFYLPESGLPRWQWLFRWNAHFFAGGEIAAWMATTSRRHCQSPRFKWAQAKHVAQRRLGIGDGIVWVLELWKTPSKTRRIVDVAIALQG